MGIFKVEVSKYRQVINTLDNWEKLGKPMRDNHWKDGRSAKELARYILKDNGELPKEIEDVLLKIGFKTPSVFKAEPERITSLVGQGAGRHHDLFLEQEEIVIGIEAKVDEELGKMVVEELLSKNISENKVNRINTLYKNIYNCYPQKGTNIRYQLLTGVSGVLLEAQRKRTPKALFLIITFKKEGSYDERKVASNNKDIDTFINSLSENKSGNAYKFQSYPSISLYIEHIEINVK